jgi:hypothetical protein
MSAISMSKNPGNLSLTMNVVRHGYLVKEGFRPRYDYLPLVDKYFLK